MHKPAGFLCLLSAEPGMRSVMRRWIIWLSSAQLGLCAASVTTLDHSAPSLHKPRTHPPPDTTDPKTTSRSYSPIQQGLATPPWITHCAVLKMNSRPKTASGSGLCQWSLLYNKLQCCWQWIHISALGPSSNTWLNISLPVDSALSKTPLETLVNLSGEGTSRDMELFYALYMSVWLYRL